jgi:hypothetical protein
VARKTLWVGALSYDGAELERHRDSGEVLDIRVLGLLTLQRDISPELARATIRSLEVHGVLRASEAVKAALADRTK